MNDVIKLVRTYRITAGLGDRLQLAEEIFRLIEPDLRLFVFSRISNHASAEDILQEILKAVITGLKKFEGSSNEVFWSWCYRITRNKLNDYLRKTMCDRLQPMSPEDLSQFVESSVHASPLSPADKHDLDYAMKLLASSKPECYDFLWNHYIIGLDYTEIAEEQSLSYDNVRMKIGRCLNEAKSLVF